jgi:hypothetical protein
MTCTCCDLHSRNCEPPSELCCEGCTEAAHPAHADGSTCSNPDLNPRMVECISCGGSDPRCPAYHPEYGFTCILPPHSGPHYDTGGGHWDALGQLFPGRFVLTDDQYREAVDCLPTRGRCGQE